jgi:predicted RNA-binding protein with PIN domain
LHGQNFASSIQIFYSRAGQTADAVIERLAAKYAAASDLIVATSDSMERQTVVAYGAECISPEGLRDFLR